MEISSALQDLHNDELVEVSCKGAESSITFRTPQTNEQRMQVANLFRDISDVFEPELADIFDENMSVGGPTSCELKPESYDRSLRELAR